MVPARTWKCALKLAGKLLTKGDSLELARAVFPELDAEVLKLKKHHGRAEALLIAAHGHRADAKTEDLLSNHLKVMVDLLAGSRKRKRPIEATSTVRAGPSTM